ncbi:MAG: ECF transporter S component [Bacilli bacterium]|nr:ECF transporter S component [Bacilli bacterium]
MKDNLTGLCIAIGFFVVLLAKFFAKFFFKTNTITTRFIARTGVFAAISIILYIVPGFKFSLPFFPSFLEIHLDEIPAFLAGFAYGPLSGFIIILVKTIVKLPLTSTACVGELADFIYSVAFVVPAALIYKKNHTLKGAFISMLIAVAIQVTVSSIITTFVMLDAYSILYNMPKSVILSMCQKINPAIDDLGIKFLLMVALPFNALKDAIVFVVTFLLYKRLRMIFKKIDAQKN